MITAVLVRPDGSIALTRLKTRFGGRLKEPVLDPQDCGCQHYIGAKHARDARGGSSSGSRSYVAHYVLHGNECRVEKSSLSKLFPMSYDWTDGQGRYHSTVDCLRGDIAFLKTENDFYVDATADS